MSVLDMALSDDLAEAIGQVAISTVIESSLCRVEFATDTATGVEIDKPTTVTVWSGNAAEQIGQTILERFKVERK